MSWMPDMAPFFRGAARESRKEADQEEPQRETAAAAVVSHGLGKEADGGAVVGDDRLLSCQVSGTYPVLDVFRAGCAVCVVLDVGSAGKFSDWNVLFSQAWVLQWSFVIGGVCYAISERPLYRYVYRLGMYLALGVGSNWASTVIAEKRIDSFSSVLCQMWFVAGLIVFAMAFAPMKKYLRQVSTLLAEGGLLTLFRGNDLTQTWEALSSFMDACIGLSMVTEDHVPKWVPRREIMSQMLVSVRHHIGASAKEAALALDSEKVALEFPLTVAALGAVWFFCRFLFYYVISPTCVRLMSRPVAAAWPSPSSAPLWNIPLDISDGDDEEAAALVSGVLERSFSSAMAVMLAVVYPKLSAQVSKVVWLMLLSSCGLRLLLPEVPQAAELLFSGLDSWVLGLVCFHYGVWRRDMVREYLMRYWFVVLWVCSTMWQTGPLLKKDDPRPAGAAHFHVGGVAVEMCLMIFFLVGMEALVDPKMLSVERSRHLRRATMTSFLFCRAACLLFPSPMNWGILSAIVMLTLRGKDPGWMAAHLSKAFLKPSC